MNRQSQSVGLDMPDSNRGWWSFVSLASMVHSVREIEMEMDNMAMDTLSPIELMSALRTHHRASVVLPKRQWLIHDGKLMLVIPERWGIPDSWVCTCSMRLPAPDGKGLLTVGDLIREGLARQRKPN